LTTGEHILVQTIFTNQSAAPWPADKLSFTTKPLNGSYHWTDLAGKEVVHDGRRTSIRTAVASGETVTLMLDVVAPSDPGDYLFVPDLVEENVAWFGCSLPKGPYKVEVVP
jgi:hypothetical protein